MDRWFGLDMQRDTLVSAIHSYDLGSATGVIGSIDSIESVVVNGVPLEGYIDIGLIDTMGDMMIETFGAVVYAVVFALDKGRRCLPRSGQDRPRLNRHTLRAASCGAHIFLLPIRRKMLYNSRRTPHKNDNGS